MKDHAVFIQINDGKKYTGNTVTVAVFKYLFTPALGYKNDAKGKPIKPVPALKTKSNLPFNVILQNPSKTEQLSESSAFDTFLDRIDSNTLTESDLDIFLESFSNEE